MQFNNIGLSLPLCKFSWYGIWLPALPRGVARQWVARLLRLIGLLDRGPGRPLCLAGLLDRGPSPLIDGWAV
jgi:hypothetical protein